MKTFTLTLGGKPICTLVQDDGAATYVGRDPATGIGYVAHPNPAQPGGFTISTDHSPAELQAAQNAPPIPSGQIAMTFEVGRDSPVATLTIASILLTEGRAVDEAGFAVLEAGHSSAQAHRRAEWQSETAGRESAYQGAVRFTAGMYRAAAEEQENGNAVVCAALWCAINHPNHGRAIARKIAAALRNVGIARLTWRLDVDEQLAVEFDDDEAAAEPEPDRLLN